MGVKPAGRSRGALQCCRIVEKRAEHVPCLASLTVVPRLEDLVLRDKDHDCEGFGKHGICVKVEAVAHLPTRAGAFRIVAFWNNRDSKETGTAFQG